MIMPTDLVSITIINKCFQQLKAVNCLLNRNIQMHSFGETDVSALTAESAQKGHNNLVTSSNMQCCEFLYFGFYLNLEYKVYKYVIYK